MTTPDDDLALIERHKAGDREAFGQLIERHRDRLWAVALRTLGDREDAADALQDALLSAYRGAGNFRGSAAVTTWLHRIVVNACIDLARRRASRPTVATDAVPDIAAPSQPTDSERDVMAMLAALPTEQAAAVVLVDIEGFPVAEAADILDVPVGTVKSRCARGRARLAAAIGNVTEPPAVSSSGSSE